MQVFIHHIYELKKGLRRMVLHTCPAEEQAFVEAKLQKENIPYLIHTLSSRRFNVFFGEDCCIDVVRNFHTLMLQDLTDQEDFILGTLLGYDLTQQCHRFLERCAETAQANQAVEAI